MCFFEDFKIYSGLWPLLAFPRCQWLYTMAGQTPALHQKNHNNLRKNTIFNEHPVGYKIIKRKYKFLFCYAQSLYREIMFMKSYCNIPKIVWKKSRQYTYILYRIRICTYVYTGSYKSIWWFELDRGIRSKNAISMYYYENYIKYLYKWTFLSLLILTYPFGSSHIQRGPKVYFDLKFFEPNGAVAVHKGILNQNVPIILLY